MKTDKSKSNISLTDNKFVTTSLPQIFLLLLASAVSVLASDEDDPEAYELFQKVRETLEIEASNGILVARSAVNPSELRAAMRRNSYLLAATVAQSELTTWLHEAKHSPSG